jgi:hypothetical protein
MFRFDQKFLMFLIHPRYLRFQILQMFLKNRRSR